MTPVESLSIEDFQMESLNANWVKLDPESNIIIPNSKFSNKLINRSSEKSAKYVAKEGSNTEGLNAGMRKS